MPMYEYLCPEHGVFERRNAVSRASDPQTCEHCGTVCSRTFYTPPSVPSTGLDSLFNYGQGYFDIGAGRWFNTRGERNRWLDSKGLEPVKSSIQDIHDRGGAKPSKIKVDKWDVKEAREEAQARLKQGWRPMKSQEADKLQKELSSG